MGEAGAVGEPGLGHRLADRLAAAFGAAVGAVAAHSEATSTEQRAEAIRRFRKATKSARAILPLLASAADEDALMGIERSLSDAAAMLSPVRDRDAVLGTVHRLFGAQDEERVGPVRDRLIRALAPGEDRATAEALERLLLRRAEDIVLRAAAASERFAHHEVEPDHVAAAMSGQWRRVRSMTRPGWHRDESSEEIHEVRKVCSRLVLQLASLDGDESGKLPKPLRRLRRQLKEVTSRLGNEHDLAMLAERIALAGPAVGSPEFVEAARTLCRKVRCRLRGEAAELIGAARPLRAKEFRRSIEDALEG
jgi:hypothetical protein